MSDDPNVQESGMPAPPRATYRLQLSPSFGFKDAASIAPYLAELGVSHIYFSPYLQAAPGSTHGYDVVDHARVNDELGGEEAREALCETLSDLGLSQVIDLVPNHMAISSRRNQWWWDVLENGPSSWYARYFDVDWRPPEERLRNKVLLPILEDHYGRVLERKLLRFVRTQADFTISYHDHVFPVAPISLSGPLEEAAELCSSEDLAFAADVLAALPSSTETDAESRIRRHRDKAVVGKQLARLLSERPDIGQAIDDVIVKINADQQRMDSLLEGQNYRLAFWRFARHDMGYRRFFDIDELAGLRISDENVFLDTHQRIEEWVLNGTVEGLRIDHVDGLADPKAYLHRLRIMAPRSWIVVEKILESRETLPSSWPISGTTGYDFLNLVGGLFVDPSSEDSLTRFYQEFTKDERTLEEHAVSAKRQVLRELLGSELNRLTEAFVKVCERRLRYRDYSRDELREVLEEAVVRFPVYRTYARPSVKPTAQDEEFLGEALDLVRTEGQELDPSLVDFLGGLLEGRFNGEDERGLCQTFQQLTGPTMAKGLEDTTFYRYSRLLCLNEVGGNPNIFGIGSDTFHEHCLRIQRDWPATMTATSSHDTKRSEDVRTRIAALTEIPEEWTRAVLRWSERNERHRTKDLLDRGIEYHFYQTLVGAWPIETERVLGYLEKAIREAKSFTSWTEPNEEYESAVRSFAGAALADEEFREEIAGFVKRIEPSARTHALSQVLLKLTAPGVPDIYQGNEIWDFSLTDPDNRRPVDFAARRSLLSELQGMSPEEIVGRSAEGLPKLWVTHQGLSTRQSFPDCFGSGASYIPVEARGPGADRIVSFLRSDTVLVVAPRLIRSMPDWRGTRLLVSGRFTNVLTGESWEDVGATDVARLLARFPVGLFTRNE